MVPSSLLLLLRRLLPFLTWFPKISRESLRVDALAGLTVALVAIPQSLAYAQLAGLPPFYGLYAALVPTVIGALFGSSAQLSTGPVALTSLLTAASIADLAAAGSNQYVAYAVTVALLSGLFQLSFGLIPIRFRHIMRRAPVDPGQLHRPVPHHAARHRSEAGGILGQDALL